MAIEQLPIFCYYNQQRFTQFGSMDCAGWYGITAPDTKKQQALYPTMGRQHIVSLNQNKLIFNSEPEFIFKTINYSYIVEGTQVYQVDLFFNKKVIGTIDLTDGVWFAYLPVGNVVYALLTDEINLYVITENGTAVSFDQVTDPNAPGGSTTGGSPQFIAAFGNRFVVSIKNTPDYYLTQINLSGSVSTYFTINGSALFNRASGIVRQFAVLHSQLYIFTDFTADILANINTQISVAGVTQTFPWKINTSYNWDYGIADPLSLSVDFGRMCWLAKNNNGLVSFMTSTGQTVEDMSTQAISVLLENSRSDTQLDSAFLGGDTNGFLFQYENTILYRVSAGDYQGNAFVDLDDPAKSIEYNFKTKTWGRVIELNGERCRVQKHVYFSTKHLVTVQGDPAIYEMAGNIYHNELRNSSQDPQLPTAFIKYPFRYELVTQQIFLEDYAEFIDDYVQIDFVFGDKTFYKSYAPFLNTVFLVDESSTPEVPVYIVDEDDQTFVIAEGSNTPTFDDNHYNALFKPHIELYYSDDGGVTFTSADLREFSQLGQYRWLMRWYELGTSRNRCYKLICVSSAPVVILGGVRDMRRASGGAN